MNLEIRREPGFPVDTVFLPDGCGRMGPWMFLAPDVTLHCEMTEEWDRVWTIEPGRSVSYGGRREPVSAGLAHVPRVAPASA